MSKIPEMTEISKQRSHFKVDQSSISSLFWQDRQSPINKLSHTYNDILKTRLNIVCLCFIVVRHLLKQHRYDYQCHIIMLWTLRKLLNTKNPFRGWQPLEVFTTQQGWAFLTLGECFSTWLLASGLQLRPRTEDDDSFIKLIHHITSVNQFTIYIRASLFNISYFFNRYV